MIVYQFTHTNMQPTKCNIWTTKVAGNYKSLSQWLSTFMPYATGRMSAPFQDCLMQKLNSTRK